MLNRLNTDAKLMVLTFLDFNTLDKVSRVSKEWASLTNQSIVWRHRLTSMAQTDADTLKNYYMEKVSQLESKSASELCAIAKLDEQQAKIILQTPSLNKKLTKYFLLELIKAKPSLISLILINELVSQDNDLINAINNIAYQQPDVALAVIATPSIANLFSKEILLDYANLNETLAAQVLIRYGTKLTSDNLLRFAKASESLAKIIFNENKLFSKFTKYDFLVLAKANLALAKRVLTHSAALATLDKISISLITKAYPELADWAKQNNLPISKVTKPMRATLFSARLAVNVPVPVTTTLQADGSDLTV